MLFGILFFWQVPHFLAISIYRQEDYERAGLKTLPAERGLAASKRQAFLHTGALVVCTILLALYGTAGIIYLTAALALGLHFLWVAAKGFRLQERPAVDKWAKKLFVTSLIYLTALFAALMIDAIVL